MRNNWTERCSLGFALSTSKNWSCHRAEVIASPGEFFNLNNESFSGTTTAALEPVTTTHFGMQMRVRTPIGYPAVIRNHCSSTTRTVDRSTRAWHESRRARGSLCRITVPIHIYSWHMKSTQSQDRERCVPRFFTTGRLELWTHTMSMTALNPNPPNPSLGLRLSLLAHMRQKTNSRWRVGGRGKVRNSRT